MNFSILYVSILMATFGSHFFYKEEYMTLIKYGTPMTFEKKAAESKRTEKEQNEKKEKENE